MFPNHYKNKDRSKRQASAWHACLCWLLCLTVWRGPVPVIHDHSLDLNSLSSNFLLAEHAFAYHADCVGQEDTGLHFHLMLLDQSSDTLLVDSDLSNQHDLEAVDSFLQLEQHNRFCLELNAALLQTNQGDAFCIAEDLRISTTANTSFLQTRLCGKSAIAVLCVCLC